MMRKCQQYVSHAAVDENLPQEAEDFKELQIIKSDWEDHEEEGHLGRGDGDENVV